MPNLRGKICLVTGGSKGIGRGIALQLGKAGATVYVTGRTKSALESCCAEINEAGGKGIPTVVDHSKDDEVEQLFERIGKEQQGKLDVLVNNAYSAINMIFKNGDEVPFWEMPAGETWDIVNNVGLRNHYLCTVYAARMMVPRKSGLIVNISSIGGQIYLFNVPYGAGKAAMDKMAHDCAQELKEHNVTMIALWPGAVRTEKVKDIILENDESSDLKKRMFQKAESLEFSGKAVAHLAADTKVHKKTGRVLLSADVAREYGFGEDDGSDINDMREIRGVLAIKGFTTLAGYVPSWVRLPHFLFYMMGYKF